MKIGLIGTGRHGSRYANHLINDCEGAELSAISRRSEQGREQAKSWQTSYHQDYKELIESDQVEAVIAAVPPVLNPEIAKLCARSGKPLLVEKPLATNSKEGEKIIELMKEASVPLTVGQTLRYNPVIRKLREELPKQGKLFTVYANQRLEPSDLQWLENPVEAGGGITFHIAVHVFDVEMEQGVAGIVDVSKLSSSRSGRYEFICDKAQLHGDQIHGYVDCIAAARETRIGSFGSEPTIPHLLTDWLSFLQGEGENPVTGEEGLYAIRVSEASLESSEDSRWVNV